MKLVTGDTVIVRTGKDRGKRGPILRVLPKESRVVVEGVNLIKKHAKPTKQLPHGGIITQEASLAVDNVQLICPECSQVTKVKKQVTNTGNLRVCARCGAALAAKKAS